MQDDFDLERTQKAFKEVQAEYLRAISIYPRFASAHEGYSIVLEELEELWDEIKKKNKDIALMRAEASQVAAMAIRFMVDLE